MFKYQPRNKEYWTIIAQWVGMCFIIGVILASPYMVGK